MLKYRAAAGPLHESPASRVHLDGQLGCGSDEVDEVRYSCLGAARELLRARLLRLHVDGDMVGVNVRLEWL